MDTLRLALPGLEVAMVPGICGKPAALERAMASYGPRHVVIGCRAVSRRRGELLASLRRGGAPAAGVCLVDLRPFESAGTELVFEQSVALVRGVGGRGGRGHLGGRAGQDEPFGARPLAALAARAAACPAIRSQSGGRMCAPRARLARPA